MKVAVMGYGTIGSGVVEVLEVNKDLITDRVGEPIEVKYILDLREFPGDPYEKCIVHDYKTIVNDPEIAIVVEAMGGVEPAYTFVKAMLLAGKQVTTSNKNLVAEKGAELIEIARERNLNFMFGASVGGGIPIIRPLNTCLTADEIEEILDANYSGYGPLKDRSNLKLVLDKFPEKIKKKMVNWAADGEVPALFVIRIPNLVIFHGDIKKNAPSKAKFFDLVIEVIRSGKSLPKLKKKRPEEFAATSRFFVESTVKVLKEFGVSCAHIPLNKDLYVDPHDYASLWCKELTADKNGILTRIVFCTPDPDDLVSFNHQVVEDLLAQTGVTVV